MPGCGAQCLTRPPAAPQSLCFLAFFLSFFFLNIYLFIFREKERNGEREGEKHQCMVASCAPPTGDLTRNPGMCPDWESNRRHFGLQSGAQSTEPHQLGRASAFYMEMGLMPEPPPQWVWSSAWHVQSPPGVSRSLLIVVLSRNSSSQLSRSTYCVPGPDSRTLRGSATLIFISAMGGYCWYPTLQTKKQRLGGEGTGSGPQGR